MSDPTDTGDPAAGTGSTGRTSTGVRDGAVNAPASSDWSETTRATVDPKPAAAGAGSAPARTTTSLPSVDGRKSPSVPPASSSSVPSQTRKGKRPAASPAVDQYAALGTAATTVDGARGAGTAATAPAGVQPGAKPAVKRVPKAPARPRAERGPRRARLQLRHLNVWSVFKFSCVLALAMFFVWLIMVGVLYGILDVSGVFDRINESYKTINGSDNAKNIVNGGTVFLWAILIGLVNIVLTIALSTIGSTVYNLCADLVGGVEVTLAERD